jgi:uncharacterized protein YkwD
VSIRRAIAVAGIGTALAVAPAAFARHGTAKQTSVQALAGGVLVQLNAIRTAHGLVPLKPNALLSAAAKAHSSEMLADGYFAHNSHDGAPFFKRLTPYSRPTAPGYWSVGENLLWSSPNVDAASALRLWMASPEHRRNILTSSWREIGIAAIHADSAPGTYGGQPVTVITTDFGVRQ